MQPTKTVAEFVHKNDQEFKHFVASICRTLCFPLYHVEDIVQEIYLKFLTTPLFKDYDPKYCVSTWLYPVVSTTIFYYVKKNKVEIQKFNAGKQDIEDNESDNVSTALQVCPVAREFQMVLDYNHSVDGLDGLNAWIQEFENKWLGTTSRNKKFSLTRRRDKTIKTSKECTLLEIFRLISLGLSNRQMAEIYGCSNVFISQMKQMIVKALRDYGFNS